jgi:capsular polysaccharide biosynthesis protein
MTAESGLRQHDHQPWPVFWTRADDARLTGSLRQWRDPAGRVCREGNYHLLQRRRLGEDRLLAPWFPGKETRLEGAWTSLASNWGDGRNYFHWITDNLTRLLVREHLPEPTRILLPRTGSPYISETLELLGIAETCVNPAAGCLQPERYYFCSPVAMSGVWNPLGFDWLRESLRKYFRPPASGPPVFLTRRASTRVPGDLLEIERIFAKAGFEIVDCGKLGVRQQIELTSGAKAVAGIHGAAMTNLLWSPPGTPVLELFLPNYLNACYEQIAFQGGLHYMHRILGGASLGEVASWCGSLP